MKVVLIDDHPLVLKGLTAVLSNEKDFKDIEQATNKTEAMKIVSEMQPDLVIVDVRLGKESGLDIIESLKVKNVNCKYVVLTSSSSLEDFKRANQLSVDGYISKEALPEEFLAAIRVIAKGRKFFEPQLVQAFMLRDENNPLEKLTSREREVLTCLGMGLSNQAIGKKIYVTEHTVKKHVSQILAKLSLLDRTQAALFAFEHFVKRNV